MKRLLATLSLSLLTLTARAQLPFVLQEYLHREGTQPNQQLGKIVAGIGDYNRDGRPDVAVANVDPVPFGL